MCVCACGDPWGAIEWFVNHGIGFRLRQNAKHPSVGANSVVAQTTDTSVVEATTEFRLFNS